MAHEAPRPGLRAAIHLAQPAPPHNLPASLTSFVGRSRELAQLVHLLDESREITLVGTGGVGKSRLAIEAARCHLDRFADGVWLVDLAGIRDPRLVMITVAATVGIAQGPVRSLPTALSEILRQREMLLIFDNCEHLIAACADLTQLLVNDCPNVRVLATSREPLGIDGERLVRLGPLPAPPTDAVDPRRLRTMDAARLFAERARRVDAEFELSASVAAPVAEICRRLDGLPLALELAAARLRTMTVTDLASGLDRRFQLLTTGSRTAHPRHRTLRGMVEWSTALLDDAESRLLRRLAVFAGGWTRESAVSVCQGRDLSAEDVSSALDSLVDRSLVVLDDWRGTSRYRLLDTMRSFATERLVDACEEHVTRRRHHEHFIGILLRSRDEILVDELGWLARMDAELENVRAALDWCAADPSTVERALYATYGLWVYCEIRGLAPELVGRYEELLALVPSEPYSAGQLIGEALLCHCLGQLGDIERLMPILAHMTERAPAVDDPWALLLCSLIQLQVKLVLADPSAVPLARRALARDADRCPPWGSGAWLWFLGETLARFGQSEEARARLTHAMEVLRLPRERAFMLRALGLLDFRTGRLEEAEQRLRESLELLVPFVDIRNLALALEELACVDAVNRRWERAACLLGASEMLFGLVSTVPPAWWQLDPQAAARRCRDALGDTRYEAEFALGRAMDLHRALAYALEKETPPGASPGSPTAGRLSQRELEVAGLVAEGFSNRRIAETLVVSQKTVESHVAHALTKLGLRSRASLAVWAAQHRN